jgi:hypothetical protein
MMSALYQALLDDRELRLARLASAPADAEPVAIFIRPERYGWPPESSRAETSNGETILTKVFTSWDAGRNAYDKERLASLQVAIWDRHGVRQSWDGGDCGLKSYGWVNGVWDVRDEDMGTYIFPLAGISEDPSLSESPRSTGTKKRKRGEHENESEGRG